MKKSLFLILFLITSLLLTGCSAFIRQSPDDDISTISNNEAIKKMSDLESGKYYILHKNEYYPLSFGDASFSDFSAESTSSSRTCWYYNDSEKKIPTLYSGDKLIYCNDTYIEENFQFERFEDMGYTVGICNLSQRDSGRYAFDALLDDEALQIAEHSDAYKLYELENSTAVIETISDKVLPKSNISRGGTILGLAKNQKYKFQIYIGTQLYEYSLFADSLALTSMEDYLSHDYSFLESRIAEIKIPKWFNTGYYMINDGGLFRYVKNRSYNNHTDFNIPNVEPQETDSSVPEDESVTESVESEKLQSEIADTRIKRFALKKEQKVRIVITWKDKDSDMIVAAPSAKVIGDNAAYSLQRVEGTNALSLVKTLPAGNYKIVIDNIEGREYEIEIK